MERGSDCALVSERGTVHGQASSSVVGDVLERQGVVMPMNTRGQLILLWSAPVAGALFLFAYFMFPVFVPPMSPTMTPEQVAGFFREHATAIRGVLVLCNLIGCTLVPL